MKKKQTNPNRRCDGIARRDVLKVGALSALGLTLPQWLRLQAAEKKKAPACILLWLDGGPSHLETFDLKPDAPSEVRGPFDPIKTSVNGIEICELMPNLAKQMDKVAIIRSMTSPLGEHNFGSHYMLTGYKPSPVLQYPSYGSVVAKMRGSHEVLPPYIAVPSFNRMAGEGFLPSSCSPFAVGGDPGRPGFAVRDLNLYPEMTPDRLERRKAFRQEIDAFSRGFEESTGNDSPELQQAYRLISSPQAKKAFDLSLESGKTRNRYGRKTLGQSCLMARRLIEAGAHFVTVTDRGWDTHNRLVNRLKEGYTGGKVGKIPTLDLAFSALLEDLDKRGMLDTTLVVVMGEFGRTPKLNTAGGRDHWPRVFSVALAGAGIKGGQVIGKSDSRGEGPAHRPVKPEDLARTIYQALGISARHELHTSDGRPILVNQHGKLISELI